MAKLRLEPGEYLVEDPVPRYGPVQDFVFRYISGPLTIVAATLVGYWMPKAFSHVNTNPTLAKEPVYRMVGYVYIPLVAVFVGLCLYGFLSIYREKIILTNKAILRRNVFSTDRISLADITAVDIRYESFNFNQKAHVNSFMLGVLLGINWQTEIRATNNRKLTIRNMAKSYAQALKAKLDAVSNVMNRKIRSSQPPQPPTPLP